LVASKGVVGWSLEKNILPTRCMRKIRLQRQKEPIRNPQRRASHTRAQGLKKRGKECIENSKPKKKGHFQREPETAQQKFIQSKAKRSTPGGNKINLCRVGNLGSETITRKGPCKQKTTPTVGANPGPKPPKKKKGLSTEKLGKLLMREISLVLGKN